jgi:xylitol oxidase
MKKRTFLKLSSAVMAGSALSPLLSWQQEEKLKNWAGNVEYSTGNVSYPDSLEQLIGSVKSQKRLKVLGTRHCFNTIADSADRFISLKHLDQVLALDPVAQTVTVGAGITYGQLGPYLDSKGFALHNLASLPHISIAGAITTATHGSGVTNGNLSTAVSAIEWVTASGERLVLSRAKDGPTFRKAVIGLGALGVISSLTLDIQPTYQVRQVVYENLPMEQVKGHFEEIMASGYSVSLFTDWQQQRFSEVWIKSRVGAGQPPAYPPDFFGAQRATKNLHPIVSLSAVNCTEQMGIPGPWYDRLPHFRMGFTPSSGKELQSEYFIPHHHAVEAILAIERLGEQVGPQLMISEIRAIAQDDLPMSPCYQQPSVTIHFTWKQNWPEVRQLLPVIERELEPFQARPHWGKLFTMPPSKLKSLYPLMPEFLQLVRLYDPNGKFRNKFLDTYIV